MTPLALPIWLWSLFFATAALYLLLAICRRNVSIRPLRLGFLAAAAILTRLILWPLVTLLSWEWLPIAFCVIAAAIAPQIRRIWLIHANDQPFRDRLENAARGLRLEYRETAPGSLGFIERQQTQSLSINALFPAWLLVSLPHPTRPTKTALLVDWVAKQYPGPVPRIHIRLSGKG